MEGPYYAKARILWQLCDSLLLHTVTRWPSIHSFKRPATIVMFESNIGSIATHLLLICAGTNLVCLLEHHSRSYPGEKALAPIRKVCIATRLSFCSLQQCQRHPRPSVYVRSRWLAVSFSRQWTWPRTSKEDRRREEKQSASCSGLRYAASWSSKKLFTESSRR